MLSSKIQQNEKGKKRRKDKREARLVSIGIAVGRGGGPGGAAPFYTNRQKDYR